MSQNIAHRFFENVNRLDGKLAIVAKQGNTWQSHSYTQLGNLARNYQKTLAHAGIKPGMRVMLMVKPGPDFMALTFALFAQGATAILIDPGMGVPNLLRCIEHVAPEAVIGIPKAMLLTRLKPGPFKSARIRLCLGFNALGWFGPSLTSLAASASNQPNLPVANVTGEELAAIIFTTGSTGPPKGVEYPHRVFARQLDYIESFYGIGEADTDQPGFPLFGLFAMALGGTSIIPDMDPTRPAHVDPVKFIETIKRHQVTYSFGSPAIWRVVANYCAENNITLDTIKLVLMAGAPVPGNLIKTLQRVLPADAEIHTPYGATESLPAVDMEGRDIVNETWALTCQGKGTCVGKPLPGIEVAIIEPTDGPIPTWDQANELPTGEIGEIGEITIKGDIVTPGYFNHAEHTAAHKIKDGDKLRHRIGDVGYKDEQGRLWFCGRKAHRVLTVNGPMYTIPCEGIINTLGDVYRSALVGIGQPGQQIPAIIVEPETNYTGNEADLLNQVKAKAAESALTQDIQHFFVHPSFPVDIRHNAKIFREKLAVWAAEHI